MFNYTKAAHLVSHIIFIHHFWKYLEIKLYTHKQEKVIIIFYMSSKRLKIISNKLFNPFRIN